uniref:Nonstructural protein 3 n=1 Tax=Kemerovo virus TaxID=40064 RepID=A0A5S9BE71_9REOV|nr:nonstructural protein 3 [Kemerovo virus]
MLAALEMKQSPTAPPAYAATPMANVALGVLQNAITSTTGANETARNEKAAYGAAVEALKDDETTRMLKAHVNETSLREAERTLAKLKRKCLLLHCAELMCLALTIGISVVLMITSAADALEAQLKRINMSSHVITGLLTAAAIGLQRARQSHQRRKKSMKRDLVKKQMYVSFVRRMGSQIPESSAAGPDFHARLLALAEEAGRHKETSDWRHWP